MLGKQFDPIQTEQQARQYWSEENFGPQGNGKAYCIVLPPPNVTGTLHIGHSFQHTLMDALIRYHRMCGDQTLWQVGTDHAGIATQMVVEKQLLKEGLDRKTIGREEFNARVWKWKEQSGHTIISQMKRLGMTCDWSRLRFTMDEDLSKTVTAAFIKLYEDHLIYRGTRLVNWDPVLQTALSDLEVLSEEEQGHLWYIKYPIKDDEGFLIIATTRPETILADAAIAVHPNDERYQHLIGKKVLLPLAHRELPIIADDHVDPEFGTGCVKITPAHDFNDFEVGKRHQLMCLNIFTKDAKLNHEAPVVYQGLTREEAREKIVHDLTKQNLIEKIEAHVLQIPRSERSGVVIEPYLTEQWYVKMEPLAKPALEVVEKGNIQFIPENWMNTYRQWLTNIQDWCISRQLWWGHRIPAWYDEVGNIYVASNEKEAHIKSGGKTLRQDEDVLDTWFSSALWPFSTLGWPEKTATFETFYPTNVLITGFDLIFFWVARMIMFGLYFTKKIPFKQVLFTGLIRDHHGQKMSKSKGNGLDPIDLIEGISLENLLKKRISGLMLASQTKAVETATRKQFPNGIPAFGEDALRFTYGALAGPGRDICFDLMRVEGNRNFCNKIWNATRFIQIQLEKCGITHLPFGMPVLEKCDLPEQWIISKLNHVIADCHKHFDEYRFDLLAQTLYEFTWYEFCDWYIEFVKIRLSNSTISAGMQAGVQVILQVLVNTLEIILHLLHPLMPFITEDLWQHAVKPVLQLQGKSLMLERFPDVAAFFTERKENLAGKLIEKLKEIILGIRQIRNFYRIEPKQILPMAYVQDALDSTGALFEHSVLLTLIKNLAKVETLKLESSSQTFDQSFGRSQMMQSLIVLVPLKGLVDLEAEKTKTLKEFEKLKIELEMLNKRLENPKAPADILAKWQVRRKEIQAMMSQFSGILK